MISECTFLALKSPKVEKVKLTDFELPEKEETTNASLMRQKTTISKMASDCFIYIMNDSYLELRDCLIKSELEDGKKHGSCFSLNGHLSLHNVDESPYIGVLSL